MEKNINQYILKKDIIKIILGNIKYISKLIIKNKLIIEKVSSSIYNNKLLLKKFKCVKTLSNHRGSILGIVQIPVSENTKLIATACYDSTIKIFNLEDYTCIKTL